MRFRSTLGYEGNVVGDFVSCSILYPQALAQMLMELESDNVKAYLEEVTNHDE